MSFHRAAARTTSAGDADNTWHGRWRPTRHQAEQQALRWAFERPDPPDQIWLEEFINGRPVIISTLLVLGDEDAA